MAKFLAGGSVPPYQTLVFYGDSISDPVNGFPWLLWDMSRQYGPLCDMKKYTRPGTGVLYAERPLSALVDLSPTDTETDKVFCLVGTNDDDMTDAFRAEYQAQVVRMQAKNPNAQIYLLGITQRWDEETTKRFTHNPMIQQIAINTGAIYIETDEWIEQADTYDGLHPNDAGYAKIAEALRPYAFGA